MFLSPFFHNSKPSKRLLSALIMPMLFVCGSASAQDAPQFKEISVHDPSVIKADDGYFYIYGSHMAAAKSLDLINWEMISFGPSDDKCTLFDAVQTELGEALAFAKTTTFWAPDVQQLNDGRYYFYYCCCVGNAPLSALGVAVSDNPAGPYKDLGIFLRSGYVAYNATVNPNVIDPHTFFDKDGRLWMVYGSYSGGIFILEMDPNTGFPLEGQNYGKKLLGKNHSRIEGPYILYNKDTDYYYLFLSFGGLGVSEGYNIRVCRSKNPDGPYLDMLGQDMINCGGRPGTYFNDPDIEPYGVKLMGSYEFRALEDEQIKTPVAYRSPGHNSAIYDAETDRYFILFHTRFAATGEMHNLRVHQMYFNQDGWPCVSPWRYAGETNAPTPINTIPGTYKLLFHERDINARQHRSTAYELAKDGTLTGDLSGTWESFDGINLSLTIDNIHYQGVLLTAYNNQQKTWTTCFTALSDDGAALWGTKK